MNNTIINSATPGQFTCRVVENRDLSRRYYLLVLTRPEGMQDPGAGTFIHLLIPDGGRFFLRRPFSILDCDDEKISLIIVEKGEGTQILRKMRGGETIDLIGPLGSSFPSVPGKRVLALGGGVGLAPLYYYWRKTAAQSCEAFRLLYGARDREDLFVDNFNWDHEKVGFASDDGSYGFAGNVVAAAEAEIEAFKPDVIFSCGPNPMLRAAAEFASSKGLPHYVSLENRMACALGACRSCVVLTQPNGQALYKTVCHDGPVFDADVLVWDRLPDA